MIIIFLHIPKTAGSTLNWIINQNYDQKRICEAYPNNNENYAAMTDARTRLSNDQEARCRVLRGHISFGVHKYLHQPATYITFLRNPVNRIISEYYYIRNCPDHRLNAQAMTMDLGRFVCSSESPLQENCQTRFISGIWSVDSKVPCDRSHLETAKKNMENYFSVIGLTEQFNRSLLLLQDAFGWHSVFRYCSQTVNKKRTRLKDIPLRFRRSIEVKNHLDYELYRFAEERFHDQFKRLALRKKIFAVGGMPEIYHQVSLWDRRLLTFLKRLRGRPTGG